ncbi:hypothetical protein GlitD10_1872 [Gloeomargarita lithophora Alchichica-D10]|uniref:HicB-like antitoxin of toxin-antitoxin system domain-containing protein n=1 Tax=Gloeomargarita lithophora Alchichica-D10 TaxID=1188229 RepID=A0A1J0AE24_9CYAN|nr:type II toxin-antitoxin system HicB family antitoxin [Gloeomargarita lithophora]APB34198.1 hypothetical protein GlitD10_1872 [Gloeomargarita lithophora Alchichica-D10]
MRTLNDYTVVLRPDNNATFVAYVPAIAGCHAWGATIEEAQAELIHVFEMLRDEYQQAGQELPKDVEIAEQKPFIRTNKKSSRWNVEILENQIRGVPPCDR